MDQFEVSGGGFEIATETHAAIMNYNLHPFSILHFISCQIIDLESEFYNNQICSYVYLWEETYNLYYIKLLEFH